MKWTVSWRCVFMPAIIFVALVSNLAHSEPSDIDDPEVIQFCQLLKASRKFPSYENNTQYQEDKAKFVPKFRRVVQFLQDFRPAAQEFYNLHTALEREQWLGLEGGLAWDLIIPFFSKGISVGLRQSCDLKLRLFFRSMISLNLGFGLMTTLRARMVEKDANCEQFVPPVSTHLTHAWALVVGGVMEAYVSVRVDSTPSNPKINDYEETNNELNPGRKRRELGLALGFGSFKNFLHLAEDFSIPIHWIPGIGRTRKMHFKLGSMQVKIIRALHRFEFHKVEMLRNQFENLLVRFSRQLEGRWAQGAASELSFPELHPLASWQSLYQPQVIEAYEKPYWNCASGLLDG